MPAGVSNAASPPDLYNPRGKTLIGAVANVVGGGSEIIYTVTTGKTFYLLGCNLSYKATANNIQTYILIDTPVIPLIEMFSTVESTYRPTDSDHAQLSFAQPIPIASGVTITLFSGAATLLSYGRLYGWEE